MTRAVFFAAGVAVGFGLAHLLAYVGPKVSGWFRAWNDRKWGELLRKRGLACIRWLPTRQWRRAQQRDFVRSLHDRAAATPEGRRERRPARRTAAKVLTSVYRRQSSKQR